jgi:hypothetical protein
MPSYILSALPEIANIEFYTSYYINIENSISTQNSKHNIHDKPPLD